MSKLKKRRGIGAIVGGAFLVIIVAVIVTYSTLSMNQVTQTAETIEAKQATDLKKATEEFDVVKVEKVNSQFNMTVSNTGDIPVHLTRLWVENTTDSSWPVSKYDLDVMVPSGGSVSGIGQNIGLTALDSQSYMMKLVSERGNNQKMYLDSAGDASVNLNLRATPTLIPTGFSTTLVLEVINTGSNKLVDLQAEMDSVNCSGCTYDKVSGPTPTSYDSLDPGDIAIFEWVYTIEGDDFDTATFTASLVGGVDTDIAVVTVQPVETAINAKVSFETGGLSQDVIVDDSILLLHAHQHNVPTPGYQMFSSSADGGTAGLRIDMETQTAPTPLSFFTNNGSSQTITVPTGNWDASLALRSEALPTGIVTTNDVDMIFHFEEGADGIDPKNSERLTTARDLESCTNVVTYDNSAHNSGTCSSTSCSVNLNIADQENMMILVVASDEHGAGNESLVTSVDAGGNNGVEVSHQNVDDSQSIYVFRIMDADIPNKGGTNTITVNYNTAPTGAGISVHSFYGVDQAAPDDVDTFEKTIADDIISVDSTTIEANSLIFTAFGSGSTNSCSNYGGGQTERADFAPSSARQCVTTEIKSTAAIDTQYIESDFNRAGISASSYAPVIRNPDWQAGSGPHGSGAYHYDGGTCHQSKNNVSNTDDNNLTGNYQTTSLWFKTAGEVTSEQMLVFWEGDQSYPNSDYYKISLGSDNTGKLLFEFDVDTGSTTTSCLSTKEYDDNKWYHVVTTRDETLTNQCKLYITNIDGTDAESVITASGGNTRSLTSDPERWYVGSNENTDNFFKGWIDDVMHWNGEVLNSTEADLLSHTNYGDMAHQFNVTLTLTDANGNFLSTLYNDPAVPIEFHDSKSQDDTVDAAYDMFNFTMPSLPEIYVQSNQRLNFSMAFVPSTSTWEALELDLKIDDEDFVDPFPSYLQIPPPNNPFPSYLLYNPNDEMKLFVTNTGDDGIYFVYSGTRLSFDNGTHSYASHIHYVNGSSVDVIYDSLYIPTGDQAELEFYANPTDHPCQAAGQSCNNANTIPDGLYRMATWINGYSDQGESFGRSVLLGNIVVETP